MELAAENLAMTELLDEIRTMIAERGPITVEQYMQLALAHPDLGYYMNRDPFGATGDFTTAPEISQMFGELIGLWTAEVWSSMGSPSPVRLVELGPGRGTLMSDALRAARIVPAFRSALDVRLVETSPALAAMQHELLVDSGAAVSWAQTLKEVPDGPAIVIGNEFLDALPVRQFVRVNSQWRERTVRVNGEGALVFDVADKPEPYIRASAANSEVLEVNPSGHRLMFELGSRIVKQGGAALLIDYGRAEPGFGDTLQALRRHEKVDPLACPGEADLTVHADFPAVLAAAAAQGAETAILTQAGFLARMGLGARCEALVRARPDRAATLGRQLNRLVSGDEMGELFKAACIHSPGWRPPAFEDRAP